MRCFPWRVLSSDLREISRVVNIVDFIHLTVHGGSAKSNDWLHHELNEGSLKFFSFRVLVVAWSFLPLLFLGVVVIITPELLSHFFSGDTEFLTVNIGKFAQGEGPTKES